MPDAIGGHRPPLQQTSPSSHSSFCEEVFSVVATSLWGVTRRAQRDGYRPNEVDRTNILAPGFAFFPPSPPKFFRDWPIGKSYPVTAAQLPRFSRDFLRRPTFQARKELGSRISGLRFE